jgi:hypothetical protein
MKKLSEFLLDSLHLCVLASLGIAWPLLGDLATTPEFFLVRGSTPTEVVLVALAPGLVVSLGLCAVEGIAAVFGRTVRKAVHGALIGALAMVIALPAVHRWPLTGGAAVRVAAGAGCIFMVAYLARRSVRTFVAVLAPAVLVAPTIFLTRPAVSEFLTELRVEIGRGHGRANRVPVVLVVFDELPTSALLDAAGALDRARVPAFAALAADAVWFREASTVAGTTRLALPALLTGRYPDDSGWRRAGRQNLFTLLAATHDVRATESRLPLCPRGACGVSVDDGSLARTLSLLSDLTAIFWHGLLPDSLPRDMPRADPAGRALLPPRMLADRGDGGGMDPDERRQARHPLHRLVEFSRFVDRFRDGDTDRPTFHYLHTMLPGEPVRYLPSGKVCETGRSRPPLRWEDDPVELAGPYDRYLQQVGFVDRLLGTLLDRLKATGRYHDSLVIVTADRGVSHRPGDARGAATRTNYCDIMRVPLFIKLPHQHGGRISDRNVELIDIPPTVAEVVGISVPWAMDGESVIDEAAPARSHKTFVLGVGDEDLDPAERLGTSGRAMRLDPVAWGACQGSGGDDRTPLAPRPPAPVQALVGRRVDDVGIGGVSSLYVRLDSRESYAHIEPSSPFIPCEISGGVSAVHGRRLPTWLAIAVNGRIAAVTRTFAVAGAAARFATLVPDTVYRQGANAVEVLVVREDPDSLRLLRTIERDPASPDRGFS